MLVVGSTPHAAREIIHHIADDKLELVMIDITDNFQAFLNLISTKHQKARAVVIMSNTFNRHDIDIQTSVLLLRRCFPSLVIVVIKYEFEKLSEDQIYQLGGAFVYVKSTTGNLKSMPNIDSLISQKRSNSWPVIPSQTDIQNLIRNIETDEILNLPNACLKLLKYLVVARYLVDTKTLVTKFKVSEPVIRTRIGLIRIELEKTKPRFMGAIETLKQGYLFTISAAVK